jgi:hypothetical protein
MSTEIGQAQTFSPSQPKVASITDQKQMKFTEALTGLLDRTKAITRKSWSGADAGDFAYIGDEGYLMIHRVNGEHLFTVHESDIRGIDWTVIVKPQVAAPLVQSSSIDSAEPQPGNSVL